MKGKILLLMVGALSALALLASPAAPAAAQSFPKLIDLPNGWLPEGVVTGRGPIIYAGSRRTGAIYAADLRTGEGYVAVPPQQGRIAVGLSYDQRSNYLFAAGGPGGAGYVYDAASGAGVGAYQFVSDGGTFVNDVIVTREAAYFTDSQRPVIYRVALGPGGELAAPGEFTAIPLSGDYQQQSGFNANGIEASPDGRSLIIVQSNTGLLFNVDPASGAARAIDLGGASVSNGDGILLRGSTLYVVRNQLNQIAVVRLSPDLSSGELVNTISDPAFDIPTTVAAFGNALYAVNARFSSGMSPDLSYQIVRVGLGSGRWTPR